jgi:hypothetical protein
MGYETRESFNDIWKRFGLSRCLCKVCNGVPDFVSYHSDYSESHEIQCSCGVRIPFHERTYRDACELWEKINSQSYTPKCELHYIGKPDACYTCMMKETCTVCARMTINEKLEHRCLDYVKELEKES